MGNKGARRRERTRPTHGARLSITKTIESENNEYSAIGETCSSTCYITILHAPRNICSICEVLPTVTRSAGDLAKRLADFWKGNKLAALTAFGLVSQVSADPLETMKVEYSFSSPTTTAADGH